MAVDRLKKFLYTSFSFIVQIYFLNSMPEAPVIFCENFLSFFSFLGKQEILLKLEKQNTETRPTTKQSEAPCNNSKLALLANPQKIFPSFIANKDRCIKGAHLFCTIEFLKFLRIIF